MAVNEFDPETPAYVTGQWYMAFAVGGFTLIGQYVRALGMGLHRFAKVTHLRNAGGLELSEICEKGPGRETKYVSMFPGFFDATVLHKTDYFGSKPWVKK